MDLKGFFGAKRGQHNAKRYGQRATRAHSQHPGRTHRHIASVMSCRRSKQDSNETDATASAPRGRAHRHTHRLASPSCNDDDDDAQSLMCCGAGHVTVVSHDSDRHPTRRDDSGVEAVVVRDPIRMRRVMFVSWCGVTTKRSPANTTVLQRALVTTRAVLLQGGKGRTRHTARTRSAPHKSGSSRADSNTRLGPPNTWTRHFNIETWCVVKFKQTATVTPLSLDGGGAARPALIHLTSSARRT